MGLNCLGGEDGFSGETRRVKNRGPLYAKNEDKVQQVYELFDYLNDEPFLEYEYMHLRLLSISEFYYISIIFCNI
jgi:hypothetical protein